MSDTDEFPKLPPHLRALQWLVTALTVVMILGVIGVVGLLVTRMPQSISTPAQLTLPSGVKPIAITQGPGWWAVVSDQGEILIFNSSGELKGKVHVDLPNKTDSIE